jgi:hypothetical protein
LGGSDVCTCRNGPAHQDENEKLYDSGQRSSLPLTEILESPQKGRHNRAAFPTPSGVILRHFRK